MKEMQRNEFLAAIESFLVKIGFDINLKGFAYLREGIAMVFENPSLINSFTKDVYPLIAKKFSITAGTVQKAIAREVKEHWNEMMIEKLNDIRGNALYASNAKVPSNVELIAVIVDMFYKKK